MKTFEFKSKGEVPEVVYQCYQIDEDSEYTVSWYEDQEQRIKKTKYPVATVDAYLKKGDWIIVNNEQEHTGGSVNYYKVEVKTPTTFDQPYWAECNDLIEALDMNYAEGNAFKAIWRRCAERQGKKKKGNNTYYDAEKIVFFAQRILEQEKEKQ